MKAFTCLFILTFSNVLFLLSCSFLLALTFEKPFQGIVLFITLGLMVEIPIFILNLLMMQWKQMKYFVLLNEILLALFIFKFSMESFFSISLIAANFILFLLISRTPLSLRPTKRSINHIR